jgi:hypothetical protein
MAGIRWSVMLPPKVYRKLLSIAQSEGITVHAVILQMLEKMTEDIIDPEDHKI